jgi:hypothetical protein
LRSALFHGAKTPRGGEDFKASNGPASNKKTFSPKPVEWLAASKADPFSRSLASFAHGLKELAASPKQSLAKAAFPPETRAAIGSRLFSRKLAAKPGLGDEAAKRLDFRSGPGPARGVFQREKRTRTLSKTAADPHFS